jgi:cytochrome c553
MLENAMKILKLAIAFTVCLLSIDTLAQGDAAAGKTKAIHCIGCHGIKGISLNPLMPNLAGQKYEYLVKQLQDFKTGTRSDPIMRGPAMVLESQDMKDLASFFSKI